jgi:signal transduction histidine kinase
LPDHDRSYAELVHGLHFSLQAAQGALEMFERLSPSLSERQVQLLTSAHGCIDDAALHVLRVTYWAFGVRVRPWIVSEVVTSLRLFAQQTAARRSSVKGSKLVVRWEQHVDGIQRYEVALDFDALRLIVSELLDNARKYCRPVDGSSPTVRLQTLTDSDRNTFVLIVSDNGEGIPSHEADLVFEEGFRGELARGLQPRGVGRGLFDCDRLMKQMGGRISLVRQPTSGAMFRIDLPRPRSTGQSVIA